MKIVAIYLLLVCKIFGPKIRSYKFFDKSQVWTMGEEIAPWRGGLVEKSQLSHILAQPRIWDEIDLGGNEEMNSEAIIWWEENANEGLDCNNYDEDHWRLLNTTEVQS